MTTDHFADYYGPCDVRSDRGVMRLHCYLRPRVTPARGSVDNRYNVLLHDISLQRVTLCLPGGVNLPVRAGDVLLRTNEPVGWNIEQYDDRRRGWTDDEFRQLAFGEWR